MSLLASLRAGTRDLHDRTEDVFVLGSAAYLTRPVYVGVLTRMLRFYDGAETSLAPWAATLAPYGLDLAARRKTPLLRRDLEALGDTSPRREMPNAPTVPTAAHALGVAYVLEGATLGGQLLRRRLAAALGLTTETGLAFFGAYGEEVGAMWRAFTGALERFDAATPDPLRAGVRASAVDGARAAFLAFECDVVTPTRVAA